MGGRRYAVWMIAAATVVLAAVAAVNATVDPFGMYRLVEWRGQNAYKPAIAHRVRLLKAYEVRRLRPDSILLSSSRGHLPFRTSHEGWAKVASRRYNLAFDGATTSEMLAYLRHADANGGLAVVLLGLDSYHAALESVQDKPDFDPSLLRTGAVWDPLRMALADARLLTSVDTFSETVRTLKSQGEGDPEVVSLGPDGQRSGEVRYRGRRTFKEHGPRALFDETVRELIGETLASRIPPPPGPSQPPPSAAVDAPPPVPSIEYIRQIIQFCRDRDIDLRLFIMPTHAYVMEVSAAAGAWGWTENGKRALVRTLAADAAGHPDRRPFPLYDFDLYSSITTEPLPPDGSRREMRYFWDASHAKQVVGDMMLDRVLGHDARDRAVPDDFGVALTAETIEAAIARNRAAAESWRRDHPEDVARVAGWVNDFKRQHGIVD